MAGSGPDVVEPEVLYCVNHPKTETLIRCSKCLDPICTKCAIRTPVGLRCPKCARIGRSPLYILGPQHYVIAAVVALAASLVAGAVVVQLGLLFTIILSAPIGGLIGEVVLRGTRGKRGRPVQIIVAVCIAVGALLGPLLLKVVASGTLASLPASPLAYVTLLFNLNGLIYAVLAIGAAVARLY